MRSTTASDRAAFLPRLRWVDPPRDPAARLFVPDRPASSQPILLDPRRTAAAHRTFAAWPGYAAGPLIRLDPLAAELGLGSIWLKDETSRFGVDSFKALGAGYALGSVLATSLSRVLRRDVPFADLLFGLHGDLAGRFTVTAATDGNHGRALAWASRVFGCQCVIFVPPQVSASRRAAIAALGAEVVEIAGTYDDAVEVAAAAAADNGWIEVSDTAHGGDDEVPRLVMEGYTTLVEESAAAVPYGIEVTHVFVQAGVGGLAGAVLDAITGYANLRNAAGIVVESNRAGGLFESVRADALTGVRGSLETIMAGLACGVPSTLAFAIARCRARAFLQIPDDATWAALRLLAAGALGRNVPDIGETGIAGLAGLLAVCGESDGRTVLGLDSKSHVLLIATEGVTDPELRAREAARLVAT